MDDFIYRAELCRFTHLKIKKNDDLTVLYFEFHIIGRAKYKYNLFFENPDMNLINQICSICSCAFFNVDLEFNAKSSDCFTFFAIFEFDEEYQDAVAFSPVNSDYKRLCWIILKTDDFNDLPVKSIATDLIESYNKFQKLLIRQATESLDISDLFSYLSSKIRNFKIINKQNSFIDFVIEAFLNSNIICDTVYSQMLSGNKEYIIIRDKRIKKKILEQVFEINEINGKYRLVSKYLPLSNMN